MDWMLTDAQRRAREEFRDFVDAEVAPSADAHDRAQRTPPELVAKLAARGYLGALAPQAHGGAGMDPVTWGLLCEEVGRGSASLLSLLTVHGMVIQSLAKWGTDAQRNHWLPLLARGERIGAFALTEPEVGSDANGITTQATQGDDGWRINGRKRWISFGQYADVLLLIAKVDGKASAFLVEPGDSGFSRSPIEGMLGFRSAMLADLRFEDCGVPQDRLVGRVGFGFSAIAGTALDHGRFCIAWGCVGLARAATEASLAYSAQRTQFGVALREHQLIQQLVADMITETSAARALCLQAALLKQRGDPATIMETSTAKYFASRVAARASADAVQVHGANGCSDAYPVQRYMRDAKIMEIIEGSNQMQQMIIARHGYGPRARTATGAAR